jgi:hypothetical protein
MLNASVTLRHNRLSRAVGKPYNTWQHPPVATLLNSSPFQKAMRLSVALTGLATLLPSVLAAVPEWAQCGVSTLPCH